MELVQDYTSDDDGMGAPSAVGLLEGLDEQIKARNAHQGRLRSFPHQEGKYATYVYFSGATNYPRSLRMHHSSAPFFHCFILRNKDRQASAIRQCADPGVQWLIKGKLWLELWKLIWLTGVLRVQ